MNPETGFYTAELNVYFNESAETLEKTKKIYHSEYFMKRFKYYKNTYKLFYSFYGDYNISCGKAILKKSGRILSFAGPNERFEFKPNLEKDFKFLFICIHPSVFESEIKEENYFRFFDNLNDENAIIKISNGQYENINSAFFNIGDLIERQYGYTHIRTACLSAITQLLLIYDSINKVENIADNLSVKIMKFIDRHYTEKISYKTLTEKFSISTPTVNTIVKNATGMTFYNYITEKRLLDAKQMLRKSWYVSAKEISQVCGFNNYNAFYKAYLNRFGISPSKEVKTDKSHKYWPFSKN